MTAPRPRKRFGQHFLNSAGTIDRIVAAIAPRQDDTLVEIGPGRGAITLPLAASGARLHAIEFDRDLVPALRARLGDRPNVSVHEADALRFDYASLGAPLRIVGNLPYNISTPLLFRLIEFRECLDDLHLMLQTEVVERLAAGPGSRAYGRLTIMAGCFLRVERLFDVPPEAFVPPPRVHSTVIRLRPRTPDALHIEDHTFLRDLVTRAFSQRRKTLRNALKAFDAADELDALGIHAGWRPEQVPIEAWVALANRLCARQDAPGRIPEDARARES